jgi:hypothetical protein
LPPLYQRRGDAATWRLLLLMLVDGEVKVEVEQVRGPEQLEV